MPLPSAAFTHVQSLVGKIIDPEQSFFRTVLERYAELDRMAEQQGLSADWRLTHEEREATRMAALAGREADLWVFAYGSLMWDPGIHVVEIRRATVHGYHRSFCLKTTLGRGSRERPGLMAGLDRGGVCHGLALRVPAELVERETEILWAREMLARAYVPSFVPVETPQGAIAAALTFEINRDDHRYVKLELEEMARMIANGHGRIGSNLEYLDNLAERLDLLGLSDPALDEVRRRARQYLRPHPARPAAGSDPA